MKQQKALHISILGHRGIPGNYGGFETFAEELASRLVKRDHRVDVYCRTNTGTFRLPTYRGINLYYLSTINNKFLDTIVHTLKSMLHATFIVRPDVILMVNVGNTILSWIPRMFGIPVILNVDGLEWERKKWNLLAKIYLRVSASLTRILPSAVVTDAKVIHDYYRDRLGLKTKMIPYGAAVTRKSFPDIMRQYDLRKNGYYLYVSRFEPENNAHLVIKAFEKLKTNRRLVMIGDAPYATSYRRMVRSTKDRRIRFLGFVFGSDYKALQQNAYAYIHATEVGGTHPALIEGMGFGNCVLVNGTAENMETANGSAIPFWFFRGRHPETSLLEKMQRIEDEPQMVRRYRARAVAHIRKNYRWDHVARQYEDLMWQVASKRASRRTVVQSARA